MQPWAQELGGWPAKHKYTAAQQESQDRTAAAHSPEPAPATAFISGYTDLRNEGRAPNVLFLSVSHYTPEPPPSFSLYPFSLSAFYIANELNWKTTGILNKCWINTDKLQPGSGHNKQH